MKQHGETYKQNIKIKIETYVELEPGKGENAYKKDRDTQICSKNKVKID
jgi:hypothetical protein